MALQFSTTYRNYMLNNSSSGANIVNALLGSGSNMLIYDNSAGVPATCAASVYREPLGDDRPRYPGKLH